MSGPVDYGLMIVGTGLLVALIDYLKYNLSRRQKREEEDMP